MNTEEVRAFFDRLAPEWDAGQIFDDEKTNRILDVAGIVPGTTVLDVGCGTGVLAPYYLKRDVRRVIAVDLSPEMIRIAQANHPDPRIKWICADVEVLEPDTVCDAVVLYNCFPHFPEPARLLEGLSRWLRPGGRLTVAHSMGLARLAAHHAGSAARVSRRMLPPEALAEAMSPWLEPNHSFTDDTIYYVSGVRRS